MSRVRKLVLWILMLVMVNLLFIFLYPNKITGDRSTEVFTVLPDVDGIIYSNNYLKGDGTDSTERIKDFFNQIPNDSKVIVTSGEYYVNEVILIKNKKNIEFVLDKQVFFKTSIHGMGIVEFAKCENIKFMGGKFSGYGVFPPLVNGNSEKQRNIHNWGNFRNSELKSSISYGNGYDGNCGIGILIHEGSKNIVIENIEVYGFNYSGIGVGFNGDENQVYSKNITIRRSYIHNNYDSGIYVMAVDGFNIEDNIVKNNGHISADVEDVNIDPGYGITMRGSKYHAKNGIVNNNKVINNTRKGIDAHSAEKIQVVNNYIENSYVYGIAFTRFGETVLKDYNISNNTIVNTGRAKNISVETTKGIVSEGTNVNINNNIITNSGMYGIYVASLNDSKEGNINKINIKNNILNNDNFFSKEGITCKQYGYYTISDNIVKGNFGKGITIARCDGVAEKNYINVIGTHSLELIETNKVIIDNNTLFPPYRKKR